MIAEIITIGDELLIGQVVDTNSAWMAQQLNLIGIKVAQITSISDTRGHILTTLQETEKRADLIFTTGGLGPTNDDITKKTLCEYFDTKLVMDSEVLKNVERLVLSYHGKMNELNRKQAEVPENCTVISNPVGTAPVMWFERNGKVFVSLPGVPYEMKYCMTHSVLPKIKEFFQTPAIIHKNVLVIGIGESMLAEKIANWENNLPLWIRLAYLPSYGIVKLRLSAFGTDSVAMNDVLEQHIAALNNLIPEYIFGYGDETLESTIGKLLIAKNKTISTAESCTGGNIAHQITSVSGSSAYYLGSVVAYSNLVKEQVLKVNPEDIQQYGAVSQSVVEQMAKGALNLLNTDFAVATSGVAGPDGGSEEKPVGTTWIAVATKDNVVSQRFSFGDNRERNIMRATVTALNMLRKVIIE